MITISIIEDLEDDGRDWRPIFTEDLVDQVFYLDQTISINQFEIALPEIFDGDDNVVVINFDSETLGSLQSDNHTLTSEYMIINNETKTLTLSINKDQIRIVVGNHTIILTLTDETNLSASFTQ